MHRYNAELISDFHLIMKSLIYDDRMLIKKLCNDYIRIL